VNPDTHAAAISYAARGWSVIPMQTRGKRPLVTWLEFQQRLAEPDEIDAWYRRWPDANVGIVTGRISGLVVVDVDVAHGGAQSLARLESELGPLPFTAESVTGGGGRHFYFAHPGGIVPNRAGVAPGIDVRGDGGCVVAPPSVHASGRRYAWVSGGAPDEAALAAMPAWVHVHAPREAHPLTHWRQLVRDGIDEGQRNTTLASLTGHLLWHGVDPQVALELLLAWNRLRCRPPLPDEEVARVVNSIAQRHQQETQAGADPRP
jgi:hypothetical protein